MQYLSMQELQKALDGREVTYRNTVGMLSFQQRAENEGRYRCYFLSNNPDLNGNNAYDFHDYRYSWELTEDSLQEYFRETLPRLQFF